MTEVHYDEAGIRLLSLAEAAAALGEPEAAVLAAAGTGYLTWTAIPLRRLLLPDGTVTEGREILYPEDSVTALRELRNPPAADPLISLAQAADILGLGRAQASRVLPRDPAGTAQKGYRLSVVTAAKAQREAAPPRVAPARSAAAARRAARP